MLTLLVHAPAMLGSQNRASLHPGCRSSFSDNIARGVQVQRYQRPSSLYAPLADMIRWAGCFHLGS